MEQIWIPVVIVVLMFGVVFANSFYSIRVGKPSLIREILARVAVITILFGAFGFYTGSAWPAIGFIVGLSLLSTVHLAWARHSLEKVKEESQKR